MFRDLFEKIFRRKELRETKTELWKSKSEVLSLEDRVKLLTSGNSINLDQHERRMVLSAIEHTPFRKDIEAPVTRAYIRTVWRGLREKIKLSIKKERK